MQFKNPPILETERLLLREISEDDVQDMLEMRSDPDVMRYIPRPLCKTKSDAMKIIRMIKRGMAKKESINWGITLKPENRLMGIAGFIRMQPENFRSEIGYMLHKKMHGKGLMSELMPVLLEFGFTQLHLNSIEAVLDEENTASLKLLEKNGFVREAHFKENFCFEGKFLDSVHYGLLKKNFISKFQG